MIFFFIKKNGMGSGFNEIKIKIYKRFVMDDNCKFNY